MNIAIASGKGGTGKTTVAVNLALALEDVQLFDCDVEEPNCNLFLGFELEPVEEVTCLVPEINPDKCTLCEKCADFCKYNALAALPNKIMFFPSLCHGCGGCSLVCPAGAIEEKLRSIGRIEKASSQTSLKFLRGILNIGEAMATPVIRSLQRHLDESRPVIFDSPPGTACPVLAVMGCADYCVLVTESTPFGFHDFLLALEATRALNVPVGVVLNRDGLGDSRVEEFCRAEGIPILLRIPNDRMIARLYSEGIPFVKEMPDWKEKFEDMFETIKALVCKSTGVQ
ncbi:(4Fe-4S)-binding protein [Methanosarcina sp. 2.H.T.1A.6]|uniref:ATP-binding protein n=1 Tax=unclassified Methanosarcina TaxID=2644672 RepID=UPI000621549F|nr:MULTISPECIES: ATP-binding protein [unclassified Methanosarcina]KKG18106.1 (4Fe-4S)-binding protein [Methanosarcina sp. 2.H.T.1A.3]KKG20055.1 (4Fe-4S)-binding protein [Methanosarcina sp. 2.H.T.1A.6]KKG22719.1 (4Fe-4S)-binding protein [Methanosarcina sp. 2.H.T.1A.8]KKG25500.1 (4Fe-4S)-binding protein [Methanosarcina sp. 2.H.T.1A.15]